MKKYTRKAIKEFIEMGLATDITNYGFEEMATFLHEHHLEKVGYSLGQMGLNAGLLKDCKTGEFYAITSRNTALLMAF